MNRVLADVLLHIKYAGSQRDLASKTGYSLGTVNKAIQNLYSENYINSTNSYTDKTNNLINRSRPKRAIILAAGFGMRMVPINTETPKALLEVHGEVLIERQIRQLKEKGIEDIYVVVGFMKEQFEYLIDDYNVKLIVNPEYGTKNNLYSLRKAIEYIGNLENTYIIPCDIWCRTNPFSDLELYSWYMIGTGIVDDATVRVNKKLEIVINRPNEKGNSMIGISYIDHEDSIWLIDKIKSLCNNPVENAGEFWEKALISEGKMKVYPKEVIDKDFVEINTYEQLRNFDKDSNSLTTDAIELIGKVFSVNAEDIVNISVLKKGMTNRSFLFEVHDEKYIMRIPGEGTGQLINRKNEASVYNTINKYKICDDLYYINPDNGYKITKYIKEARTCDAENVDDLIKCMSVLRNFHELKLKVSHTFDIWEQIEYYEFLWNGQKSVYRDYEKTKANVLKLREYIDRQSIEYSLTHIDAVPDNFLFESSDGDEKVRLIDWEYAGMQDPHVDIAMFCIYSFYDRTRIDKLIDIYFEDKCTKAVRIKIYCYVAICGLLWSNWCEYKRMLGVDFGEYSIRQYRYAKEFYRIAKEEMSKYE